MLYPFMTLKDGTEIVHSESMQDSGREKVKGCIEKPVDWGFKSATLLAAGLSVREGGWVYAGGNRRSASAGSKSGACDHRTGARRRI
jgi:hypothetical protein